MSLDVYKKVLRLKEHIKQLKVDLAYYENILKMDQDKLAIDERLKHKLTTHQQKVINSLLTGKSNAEIAAELGINFKTVKYHLTRIYALLSLEGREDLIALYTNKEALNVPEPTIVERVVEATRSGTSFGTSLPFGASR